MRPLSKGRDLLLYGHPLRRLAPLRCRQGCPCLFRLAARPIDLAEQMALVRGHAIGCATIQTFRGLPNQDRFTRSLSP